MATLSIQIRLGASRGWRVRSLIKAKFYAQSVIHCLFIFSLLRAKGFSQRMWTLHYGVFTNNSRYFIHVEYFRLPNTWNLLRPTVRQYAIFFIKHFMRLPYRPRVSSLHFVPHVKHMRRITTAMRRCPGAIQQHESLYWAWDRRAYLFTVILAQMKTHYQQHVGASEFGRFFENSQ